MGSAAAKLRFDPLRFTKRAVTADELRRLVAEAAYFHAENRRFAPGREVEDWLLAEREVAEHVMLAPSPPPE
jgi:hypothetical protein